MPTRNGTEEPGSSSEKTIKTKFVETFSKKSNTAKQLREKSASLDVTEGEVKMKTEGEVKMKNPFRRGRSKSLFFEKDKGIESRFNKNYTVVMLC